jgi:type I restriction enzyme, S subunit
MELKPGYKQTEVGVIPEDWDVKLLPDVLRFRSGKAHEQFISDTGSYICVNSKFISTGGSVRKYSSANFSPACKGDVLMVMSDLPNGRALAKAYFVEADNIYAVNQRVCALTAYRDNPKYLFYILNRNPYFLSFDDGVSQTHLLNRVFQKCPIPLPQSTKEQGSIAEALSDVDSLLYDLDQLVTKKRAVKQAAMQELLTGKRRLPGFEGEWKVKRLGDEIRDLEAGVSVRSTTDKDQPSTGRYILKTSAVSQGQFSPNERKEIISCDISRAKTPIKQGDLIISRMNTPALVGECGYSHSDHPKLFLPDRLWRAAYRDPQAVSSLWLSYTLSTQQNRTRIKELATGTSGSMKNISKRALLDLEIKWPSLDEQSAIAEVLSEMDNDINSINDQLQKNQGIKQGMMQQLLTGKIRLR